MLHFLWLILKIILAIIGVVLALVLAILLLILFCPVRYEAAALKAEETNIRDTFVTAKVSWLFRGISARFVLEERKKQFSIRLFGISLDRLLNKGGKKPKKKKPGKEAEASSASGAEQEPGTTGGESGTQEIPGETIPEGQELMQDHPAETSAEGQEQLSDQPAETSAESQEPLQELPAETSTSEQELPDVVSAEQQEQPSEQPATPQELPSNHPSETSAEPHTDQDTPADLPEEDSSGKNQESGESPDQESGESPDHETASSEEKGSFFEKISGRIGETFEKLGRLKQKAEWWTDFITDERTGFALSCVLGEVKKILAHVLPRRFYGRMSFGFEDPSITGRILAAAGATIPFHKNSVELHPSFEEKNMLDADVGLKGRIYGIRFAASAVRILLNRDVWFVIKTMKHKED